MGRLVVTPPHSMPTPANPGGRTPTARPRPLRAASRPGQPRPAPRRLRLSHRSSTAFRLDKPFQLPPGPTDTPARRPDLPRRHRHPATACQPPPSQPSGLPVGGPALRWGAECHAAGSARARGGGVRSLSCCRRLAGLWQLPAIWEQASISWRCPNPGEGLPLPPDPPLQQILPEEKPGEGLLSPAGNPVTCAPSPPSA